MSERFYEAEPAAESASDILRRAEELFSGERVVELQNYLWRHDRLRRIIAANARGGMTADKLIQLVGGSNHEQQQLQKLLTSKPEILYILPFLVKLCLIQPVGYRPVNAVSVPEQFTKNMREVEGLEPEKRTNPAANQRLLDIYEDILARLQQGAHPLFRAYILTSLGAAYLRAATGDPVVRVKQTIACSEEALKLITPQQDRSLYSQVLAQLGLAYGKLEGAGATDGNELEIKYLEQALELQTADDPPRDRGVLLSNLGNAYKRAPQRAQRAERMRLALSHYKQALTYFPADEAPLDYARVQTCMATAYSGLDTEQDLKRAFGCCQEALRYQTEENAPFDFALTMSNLANIYRDLPEQTPGENYSKAINCYQRALTIFTPQQYAGYCLHTNEDLGDLHARNANWDAAYAAYRAAIFAGERMYQESQSAGNELAAVARIANLYRLAAFAAARCGGVTEALLTLEHGKTRLLSSALATKQVGISFSADQDWLLFDRAVDTALINTQAGRLSAKNQFYSQFGSYFSEIHEHTPLLEVFSSMKTEAATKIGKIYDAALLNKVNQAVRSLTPDDSTALISFCVSELGSLAFVVYRDASKPIACIEAPNYSLYDVRRLLLTPEVDGGWLIDYTNFKTSLFKTSLRTSPQLKEAQEACYATLTYMMDELGRNLIAPIVAALPTQITKLILLPAAELFLLPLHATVLDAASGELLCDRFDVSYAPSARVLAQCYGRVRRPHSASLYMVTNPTKDHGLRLSEIAGRRIANYFPQATIRNGSAASKQAVQTEAPHYSYLHFFCHGNYSWVGPSESYLRLAANDPDQRDNGKLAFDELSSGLFKYDQTRLVVLGACEAGLADMGNQTPDEYIGLASGFLQAGVPCVICALWTVEVISTTLLLERFYETHRLKSLSFPAALREAQNWLRQLTNIEIKKEIERLYKETGSVVNDKLLLQQYYYQWQQAGDEPEMRPFAHPFYWAGFTINGV